jgi:hypothetical protein
MVGAYRVVKPAGLHDVEHARRFFGRVRDNLQQLLVGPNVMFKWRNVEVTGKDVMFV